MKKAYENRLEGFKQGIDDDPNDLIPGWKRCREVLGDSAETRTLFSKMFLAESDLLMAYERDVDSAAKLLAAQGSERDPKKILTATSPDSAAAILLVAGDPKVQSSEDSAYFIVMSMYAEPIGEASGASIRELLLTGPDKDYYRKLLGTWLARPATDAGANLRLYVADKCNPEVQPLEGINHCSRHAAGDEACVRLTAEAVAIAEDILKSVKQDEDDDLQRVYAKLYALQILKDFGNESHLVLVRPSLEDKHVIHATPTAQVRDVALLCAHTLADRPKSVKLPITFVIIDRFMTIEALDFRDDNRRRDAALTSWKAWAKENLK